MRCNNCGWDNNPGTSVCVKCGHPLQDTGNAYGDSNKDVNAPTYNNNGAAQPRPTVVNGRQPDVQPRPTVISGRQPEAQPRPTRVVNSADMSQNYQLKQTIVQSPNGQPIQQPTPPQQPGACPHCGYPLMDNMTSCPNCGASTTPEQPISMAAVAPVPIAEAKAEPSIKGTKSSKELDFDIDEQVKCEKCGADVSISFTFCPKCGERIHLSTVRAIRHKPTPAPEPPKPKCHLTIIPEEDEQIEVTPNDYEGASIILNRDNTEKSNRTITSKEQAEIICEDGKWYLLNKSELNSTLLEAGRKLELQGGDVIVLGDRRFKFEPEVIEESQEQ